jgi:hypothetical protein
VLTLFFIVVVVLILQGENTDVSKTQRKSMLPAATILKTVLLILLIFLRSQCLSFTSRIILVHLADISLIPVTALGLEQLI